MLTVTELKNCPSLKTQLLPDTVLLRALPLSLLWGSSPDGAGVGGGWVFITANRQTFPSRRILGNKKIWVTVM